MSATKKCPFTSKETLVTPNLARQLLAHNVQNRHVSQAKVEQLSQAMLSGEFKPTGDVIRFNESGEMIDGQHRLLAIIKSGVGQWFIIVGNLHPSVKFVIDQHQKRTLFQQFTMEGVAHSSVFSSAVILLNAFLHGASQPKNCDRVGRMSQEKAMKFYYEHEGILKEAYNHYSQYRFIIPKMLPPSVVVAMMVFVQMRDKTADSYIHNFFEDLFENPADLTHSASNLPILLRNKITAEMMSPRGVGVGKINELLLHCIKGYKANKAAKALQPPRNNPFKDLII